MSAAEDGSPQGGGAGGSDSRGGAVPGAEEARDAAGPGGDGPGAPPEAKMETTEPDAAVRGGAGAPTGRKAGSGADGPSAPAGANMASADRDASATDDGAAGPRAHGPSAPTESGMASADRDATVRKGACAPEGAEAGNETDASGATTRARSAHANRDAAVQGDAQAPDGTEAGTGADAPGASTGAKMASADPDAALPAEAPGAPLPAASAGAAASAPSSGDALFAPPPPRMGSEGEPNAFGPDWRAVWAERLSRRAMLRLVYGLAVGALGGWAAHEAGLPLAWMLGALFACMAFSLAGQPVMVPIWFRMLFMGLIGLFLGESFTADAAAQLSKWPATILMAVAYVPVGAFACYLLFRYAARMSRGTALLSGLPGGMTAVAMFAQGLGGDERRVALSQSMRVAFVVLLAPAVAFGLLGLPAPTAETYAAVNPIGALDLAILLAGSAVAAMVAARLNWPIPYLMGPLIASALLRFPGIVEGQLPAWLVEFALLVCGASIGTRFGGIGGRTFAATLGWTFAGTLLLMAISGLFAFAATAVLGVDIFAALLAFAPGGVAEMSLIAIAIDADPGFVATHHMARIFAILFSLPLIAARLGRFIGYESPLR